MSGTRKCKNFVVQQKVWELDKFKTKISPVRICHLMRKVSIFYGNTFKYFKFLCVSHQIFDMRVFTYTDCSVLLYFLIFLRFQFFRVVSNSYCSKGTISEYIRIYSYLRTGSFPNDSFEMYEDLHRNGPVPPNLASL